MFHNLLLFCRLQKTQILPLVGAPLAGSKTTAGANSGLVPPVNRLAVPQFVPSNRLYQIFHAPSRREDQKSQTLPALSSKAAGSVSSWSAEAVAAGSGAPKPSLEAAVEAEELTATKDASPMTGEVNLILPPSSVAEPGRATLMTAATSAAVARVISMNCERLKVTALVNRSSILM